MLDLRFALGFLRRGVLGVGSLVTMPVKKLPPVRVIGAPKATGTVATAPDVVAPADSMNS